MTGGWVQRDGLWAATQRAIARDNQMTEAEQEVADSVRRPPIPISELVGCLGPDWTGGLDSVEFVRRQRR